MDTISKEQKNLSVLEIGASDSVRCTRVVQVSTSHSWENEGALRYNSSDCSVSQRATAIQCQRSTLQSATVSYSAASEVRVAKSEGTGLSGAARRQSSNGRNPSFLKITFNTRALAFTPRHNTKGQIPSKPQIHSNHLVACEREIFVYICALVTWIAFLLFPFLFSISL
jgi:hypothetical protein